LVSAIDLNIILLKRKPGEHIHWLDLNFNALNGFGWLVSRYKRSQLILGIFKGKGIICERHK